MIDIEYSVAHKDIDYCYAFPQTIQLRNDELAISYQESKSANICKNHRFFHVTPGQSRRM